MLTPQEAAEKARRESSKKYRAQIEDAALAAANISMASDGERPDVIVGGAWPSRVIGARRASCADCAAYLALSPESGAAIHTKYPDVPVLCLGCVKIRAAAER